MEMGGAAVASRTGARYLGERAGTTDAVGVGLDVAQWRRQMRWKY
jgi:hypothetical protein